MGTTLKPYTILLAMLNANVPLVAEVGTNVWAGGVPETIAQVPDAPKCVAAITLPGRSDQSIWLDHTAFQIMCYGPTMSQAWDVYRALIAGHRRSFNEMVMTADGEAYMYALQEQVSGQEYVDPRSGWLAILSRWEMASWQESK